MATTTTVQVTREAAVELCETLGLKTANRWKPAKMKERLLQLGESFDESELEGEQLELFRRLGDAESVEFVKEDETDEDEATDTEDENDDKPAKKKTTKAKAKTTTTPGGAGKQTKKAKPAKGKKTDDEKPATKAKAKAKPKEKKDRGPTRAFCAGQIIKRHGIKDFEINDETIAEVDELYGSPNPKESKVYLSYGRAIVQGYFAK